MLVAATVLTAAGCGHRDEIWFSGDFTAASSLAKQRNTLVMLVFTAEWCTWCERMDRETFSSDEVRELLADIVAVKLDAERGGRKLAARYGVDSYPTIVFTDGDGDEVDRILGYLPPTEFVAQATRIRAGDTFLACLHRLSQDPADLDAIGRAVGGLLERSDAEGAISRIAAFQRATEGRQHAMCTELMFGARAALQSRLYSRAAKVYRKGWEPTFIAPDTDGSRHLHRLIEDGFGELDADSQSELLRRARHEDAADVLELADPAALSADGLFEMADFAFHNGHYDVAADSYRAWYEAAGDDAGAAQLNSAAWQLYLSRSALETAVVMARRAYELEPSGDVTDTLARLLYVTGDTDEALRLQGLAVERAGPTTLVSHSEALKRMEAGQELGDRPGFEIYPGGVAEPILNASRASL
jgi:thioredoxin-related protein